MFAIKKKRLPNYSVGFNTIACTCAKPLNPPGHDYMVHPHWEARGQELSCWRIVQMSGDKIISYCQINNVLERFHSCLP